MQISCEHIATNCNPMPNSIQFLNSDTLVFCFKNQIGVYSLSINRILMNLNHPQIRSARANCLKVIKREQKQKQHSFSKFSKQKNQSLDLTLDGSNEFILVGYDNKVMILYQIISNLDTLKQNTRIIPQFRVLQIIKQNESIISLHLNGQTLIVNNNCGQITEYFINYQKLNSKSKEKQLKLEHCQNQHLKEQQIFISEISKLKFPLNKLIESIATFKYENSIIMFVGGVDQKIHVYKKQYPKNIENIKNIVNDNNSKQTFKSDNDFKYCFSMIGHENAITKLTLIQQNNGKFDQFLLASASKDGYIRIWKIISNQQITKFHKNVKTLQFINNNENENNNMNTNNNNSKQNKVLKIFLESVLISHQCSVTNLAWVNFRNKIELASCSLDCTICVWGRDQEQENQNGTWTVQNRMGQLLGNKNAYFEIISDKHNNNNKYLVAINYIGSALIWEYSKENDKFTLRQSFTGHSNHVKSIDWNHTNSFLVTVSKDQTTRVLARNHENKRFAQISRAQIHGYDINAVSVIKVKDNTIDVIACGADQKVIRVVQPPACFANYLNTFTQDNLHLFFNSEEQENKYIKSKADKQKNQPLIYESYSEGGIQVLGLMTKMQKVQREKITSYYQEEQEQAQQDDEKNKEGDKNDSLENYNKPPHDDYLVKHTLWPEMNKLYGHPHEIEFLTKNQSCTLLASSCTALNKQFATILIWDIKNNWKILKMIQHHTYTVHAMQFTRNGKYFISGSRDRRIAIFDAQDNKFDLISSYECHTRAITTVSTHYDCNIVATGSRDKSLKLHDITQKKVIDQLPNLGQGNSSISSLAFGKGQKYKDILICGDRDGHIYILKINPLTISKKIYDSVSHSQIVNQIRWKREQGQFATCSDDHSIKIYKIRQ